MATKKTSASKTSGKAASKKLKALSKKAAPKKLAIKKAVVKKAPARKASVKKTAIKKASVKKTSVKKAESKKQAVLKKTLAKKPVSKAAVKKATIRKPVVKKSTAARPASKAALVAHVSKPAARGTTPSKSASGSKKRVRQNTLNVIPPALSPARRSASVVSRPKTAKEPPPKLAVPVRVPVRPAAALRKAARSAARGMAPGAVQASAPIDQKPRRNQKPKPAIDEALSEQKLREAIRTTVLYLEAWLKSTGANVIPALGGLASPAEAARAQIWRWLDREAPFGDGRVLTAALLEDALNREMHLLRTEIGEEAFDTGLFVQAAQLFLDLALAPDFEDFPGVAARLVD
jgi:malate synthase